MGITKGGLREYVSKLFRGKRFEVRKEIEETITNAFSDKLRDAISELSVTSTRINAAANELEEFVLNNEYDNDWTFKNRIRDLNNIVSKIRELPSEELSKIKRCIEMDAPYTRFGLDPLVEKYKKKLAPEYRRIQDIIKLEQEVDTVIDNAKSGKKAFEQLEKLGIDLKEYKEEQAQLPAIQKFSVDPCIINKGGCSE